MHPVDYRELALTNRERRTRHIETLKQMVRENTYQVSAADIADGILAETDLITERRDGTGSG